MNVARFLLFDVCSALSPALHLNHRCACGTTHGPAMGGWSSVLGRMATREEFVALGQHRKALEATVPHPVVGRRIRAKNGRRNGPRGGQDRGKVFVALSRCNYPGRVHLERPERQGCWR